MFLPAKWPEGVHGYTAERFLAEEPGANTRNLIHYMAVSPAQSQRMFLHFFE